MKKSTVMFCSFVMTACGGLESDDVSDRHGLEAELSNLEGSDAPTITYYDNPVTTEDIEGMEVHCIGDHEGNLKCFDTIAEADALFEDNVNSLTTTHTQSVVGWCRFYEHDFYNGSSIQFGLYQSTPNLGNFWNDRITSIWCSNAYTWVYEHQNFGGAYQNFPTTPNVGGFWNDRITALHVVP